MPEERAQRRLAAILAADVVGYSRLMERDEAGTLAALKSRRRDILQPLLAKHDGRIVKVMGDGVLAEFASAVNAVACAVELQQWMAAANEGVSEDRRIVLRVGLNLGDVVVEGSDLYGDGVNVAARLEAMAEPGSIYVSQSVRDQVRGKVAQGFDDLGEQSLKNLAEPVCVYRVSGGLESEAAASFQNSSSKPTVAILPLANMSGDPEQEYFSDGITEDIITELSRFRSLFVIARNSTFAFKGRAIDVKEIGRKLGAQYLVEGSVRRAADRLRITAQLINAAGGNHLWSERYDRNIRDVFEVQDEVASSIVGAIVGHVAAAGIDKLRRKRTGSLVAYDYFLRGLEHFNRSGAEDTVPAKQFFDQAIRIDPGFAPGYALLTLAELELLIAERWTKTERQTMAALERALLIGKKAVALDANDAMCHCALSVAHLFKKSFDLAEYHIELATKLNPNDATVLGFRSGIEMFASRPEQALHFMDMALKLNPLPPNWYREFQGMTYYMLHRYEDAARAFERETAKRPYVYRFLAACYARMNRLDQARALATESLKLQPRFTLHQWAPFEPYMSKEDLEHLREGMRMSGLPE